MIFRIAYNCIIYFEMEVFCMGDKSPKNKEKKKKKADKKVTSPIPSIIPMKKPNSK